MLDDRRIGFQCRPDGNFKAFREAQRPNYSPISIHSKNKIKILIKAQINIVYLHDKPTNAHVSVTHVTIIKYLLARMQLVYNNSKKVYDTTT
jgi:hypothetical protein